jgi:nucleoid-associated protein YgaU
MSHNNDPENTFSNVDLKTNPQHPALMRTHATQPPTPTAEKHDKHQLASIPDADPDYFIQQGKVFAHTVNAPFTTIPFIPAATTLLKKFDKTTSQDLGVTYKASISSQGNAQGGQDLMYKVDYIGFGIMSSKFNVQMAPIAAKVEVGKEVYKGLGCNASVLSNPIGSVHERLGIKATFTNCNDNNSKSVSAAAEASYQKSNSFKPLSTITYGYFFGNDASFRIKEKYIPFYNRVMADLPSWQESKIALEHIAPAFPFIMQGEAISKGAALAEAALKSTVSTTKSMFESAAKHEVNSMQILMHQRSTQSSLVPASNSLPIATPPSAKHVVQTSTADAQPYSPSYKVPIKPGDNLWNIAARETGDANQYKAIAEKNHIKDPDRISPTKEKSLDVPGYEQSNEEKATYTVRAEDTLDIIGKKTGHTWAEIFALNKSTLKNNPDKIYPGQELLIPDDHAALINNPVVQARIREIMAKQQASESTR